MGPRPQRPWGKSSYDRLNTFHLLTHVPMMMDQANVKMRTTFDNFYLRQLVTICFELDTRIC